MVGPQIGKSLANEEDRECEVETEEVEKVHSVVYIYALD